MQSCWGNLKFGIHLLAPSTWATNSTNSTQLHAAPQYRRTRSAAACHLLGNYRQRWPASVASTPKRLPFLRRPKTRTDQAPNSTSLSLADWHCYRELLYSKQDEGLCIIAPTRLRGLIEHIARGQARQLRPAQLRDLFLRNVRCSQWLWGVWK